MKKKYVFVFVGALLFVGFLLIAFRPETSQTDKEENFKSPDKREAYTIRLKEDGYSQEVVDALVDGNNQFALDLYQQYLNDDSVSGGNIFFSPISIHSALSMTYEGATGDTASQIMDSMYLVEDDELRLPSYAKIFNEVNKTDKEYSLSIANALWMQEDYPVLDQYEEKIINFYGGEARNVDFVDDTENSRATINEWVESKTNEKIKNLFPTGSINQDTRFVLTNAIYFKGDWKVQFDPEDTHREKFTTQIGDQVEVDMMKLTGETFNYMESDSIQMLEMEYKGDDLSMIVILPKKGQFDRVEQSLSLDSFDDWKEEMSRQEVEIYLPRFKFEMRSLLKPYLQELGIVDAFEPNTADFAGIDGSRNLFINSVIHKAFVEVNEEGTEAAAAIGVTVGITSIPEINVFRADRPFIFFIQQKESGNILFIGRVSNPVTEE